MPFNTLKHKNVYDLLKTLNIPVAYNQFDENEIVVPPFVAYRETKPDTFKADDITYFRPYEFEIELITANKDVALEQAIENLFTENNIVYDKSDDVWDAEEKIYHIFYNI